MVFWNKKNSIFFDGDSAQVVSNTDTELMVVVPQGLTSPYPEVRIELADRTSLLYDAVKLLGI